MRERNWIDINIWGESFRTQLDANACNCGRNMMRYSAPNDRTGEFWFPERIDKHKAMVS